MHSGAYSIRNKTRRSIASSVTHHYDTIRSAYKDNKSHLAHFETRNDFRNTHLHATFDSCLNIYACALMTKRDDDM